MENKDVDHEELATTCLYELVIPFCLVKTFCNTLHFFPKHRAHRRGVEVKFEDHGKPKFY
jgi:hypothetical protein